MVLNYLNVILLFLKDAATSRVLTALIFLVGVTLGMGELASNADAVSTEFLEAAQAIVAGVIAFVEVIILLISMHKKPPQSEASMELRSMGYRKADKVRQEAYEEALKVTEARFMALLEEAKSNAQS